MHKVTRHGNQAGGTPKANRFREKIALIAVVESIQDAVEDLAQGRVVEATASLRDLAYSLLDGARAELADLRSLSELPPIHEINAALSARRRTILEKRAETEGWNFRWDGDAFEVADTDAAFWLKVDPSDNWQASPSGSPEELASDSGLLALFSEGNVNRGRSLPVRGLDGNEGRRPMTEDHHDFPLTDDEFFGFNPNAQSMSNRDAGPRDRLTLSGGSASGRHERGGFRFVAVGDLDLSPPEFLVQDLIETDSLGVIFGEPGCGKSFLAVDLACSVATGIAFHGREVKAGPVLYIAGEGHHGLVRRFKAWEELYHAPLQNSPLFKSTCSAQFLDGESATQVLDQARSLAATHGTPSLVIVDTLARNYGPGDENSTADMSRFVAAMDRLRDQLGCVVLIVHHSGHQEKERGRGSTALKAAADAEFVVVKEGDTIDVRCTKMKDADTPPDLRFQLTDVDLLGDVPMKSAALVAVDNGGAVSRKGKPQKPLSATNQSYWEGILDFFAGEGRTEMASPKRGMSKMRCADIDDVRDHCWRCNGVMQNTSTDRSQWKRCLDELRARKKIGTHERKIWIV